MGFSDGTTVGRRIAAETELAPFGSHRFTIPFDPRAKSGFALPSGIRPGSGAFTQPAPSMVRVKPVEFGGLVMRPGGRHVEGMEIGFRVRKGGAKSITAIGRRDPAAGCIAPMEPENIRGAHTRVIPLEKTGTERRPVVFDARSSLHSGCLCAPAAKP